MASEQETQRVQEMRYEFRLWLDTIDVKNRKDSGGGIDKSDNGGGISQVWKKTCPQNQTEKP